MIVSHFRNNSINPEFSGPTTVRVGDYYKDIMDEFEEDIAVKKIIIQEYYDSWTLQNDICLLILEKPADTSSEFVSTIALPSDESDYIPGHTCQETVLFKFWRNY